MWTFGTIVLCVYKLKNENIQIFNKMNGRPSAKHVTSDIGNTVKGIYL